MSTLLWAAYVAAIGSLAALAAYVVEPVARALRWPTRWLWALALAAQLAAVLVALQAADAARPAAWFVAGWVAATAAAIVVYLRALRALRRERGEWRVTIAEEMPVWVSARTGPAVVGFLRSIVVAPGWALALAERERRMLLRHEAEHVAAWDPTLLLLGLATCAAVPWSPAAWWALARLRLAIEVDCDRRVLATEPDVAAYGELLVAVQGRVVPGAAGLAAFAERRLPLEERIEVMTATRPRRAAWRWGARGMVASALVLAACMAPRPTTTSLSGTVDIRADAMKVKRNADGSQTITAKNATITTKPGIATASADTNAPTVIRDSALYASLAATHRILDSVMRSDTGRRTIDKLNEQLGQLNRALHGAARSDHAEARAQYEQERANAFAFATLREHFRRADVVRPAPGHIAMFALDEDGSILRRRDVSARDSSARILGPMDLQRIFPDLPAHLRSFNFGVANGRAYGIDPTTSVAWWRVGTPPAPKSSAAREAREQDDSIALVMAYVRIADTVAAYSSAHGLEAAAAPVTVRILLAADFRVLGVVHGPLIARASADSVLASIPNLQDNPARGGVMTARPEHALPPGSVVVWAQLPPPRVIREEPKTP